MAAPNNHQAIQHFADPHPLEQTQYRNDEAGLCNICLLKLSGLSSLTYGCYSCNIHLHSACALYFPETISFFAHPAHTLKLRRSPGRICDICRGDCPRMSFVYSCTGCGFDVHPLCSMLPERVATLLALSIQAMSCACSRRSRQGAARPATILYPGGTTSALPSNYTSRVPSTRPPPVSPARMPSLQSMALPGAMAPPPSSSKVAMAALFASAAYLVPLPAPAGYHPGIQGYGHVGQAGSYYYAPPIHGIYYSSPAMPAGGGGYGASGSGQQSIFQNPSSLMGVIARFLLSTVISTVARDLLSELLSASSN